MCTSFLAPLIRYMQHHRSKSEIAAHDLGSTTLPLVQSGGEEEGGEEEGGEEETGIITSIDAYKKSIAAQLPKRPMLVLLAGMLDQEPRRPMGEWVILDEAHAIKNRESRTYHSILTLRLQFDSCLMMTCTPLDNKWDDGYALLSMLHGHPITSFLPFQAAFLQSLP
ncbi:hypothetical protein ACJA88_012226 [Fusarium oxysporum]